MNRSRTISRRELIAICTLCTTLAAAAIDTVLPAFSDLRADYGLAADSSQTAWIVNAFLIGMATGGLVFGTMSDRFGRRGVLIVSLLLYVAAGLGCVFAPSMRVLIVGRFIWGVGASGPRAVTMAMIRDRFEGESMARVMSLMMTAFMTVPIVAPALGAGLNRIAHWKIVFWVPVVAGALTLAWALLRLPETLPKQDRRSIGPRALLDATRIVARSRPTVGFGLAQVFLFGIISAFLSGLELIIDEVFDRRSWFPLVFAGLSLMMMAANFVTARMVQRVGLGKLLRVGAVCMLATGGVMGVLVIVDGSPPFLLFCAALGLVLAVQNSLVPNASAAAMQPVGHVAGLASSVLGFFGTAGGAVIGAIVAKAFDGTARPFGFSMAVLGVLIFGTVVVTLGRSDL